MNKLTTLDWIALILVIIGALNWGLIAAVNKDLVMMIFGSGALTRIVLGLVGLGGLYVLISLGKLARK